MQKLLKIYSLGNEDCVVVEWLMTSDFGSDRGFTKLLAGSNPAHVTCLIFLVKFHFDIRYKGRELVCENRLSR